MTTISLLQIRSRRVIPDPGKHDTPFGHPVSPTQIVAWTLLVFSLLLFVFCLVCAIVNLAT